MECTVFEGISDKDSQPLSTFERQVRRRKIIIFRPSTEEHGSPILPPEPPDRGRTSPPLCEDEKQLLHKRQWLQQGAPTMSPTSRSACDGAGETLWCVASPMEKKQRRVLAVDLEDFSTAQVPPFSQPSLLLKRPALFHTTNPLQLTMKNDTNVSSLGKGPSCAACRSLSCKVGSRPGSEPQDVLAYTCQQPWVRRLPPPCCRESERLQAKRRRLQKGASLISGSEGTTAVPAEKARQLTPGLTLEDYPLNQAQDAGVGKELPESFPSLCRSDPLELPCQLPSSNVDEPVPSDLRRTDQSSETADPPSASTLLCPPEVPRLRHWGLAPVFQSMRSKLEAFADIFLSPSKPHVPPAERSSSASPCPPGYADEAVAAQPETPRSGVNIEVKIAISEPRPQKRSVCPPEDEEESAGDLVVSGRPPIRQWRTNKGDAAPQPRLGRSYSCPDFPRTWAWPPFSPGLAPTLRLRQRRHTVCSLEVSRELVRPALPCLRKEVYPFSTAPAHLLLGPLGHRDPFSGSPLASSCCREGDPGCSRNSSFSSDGGQRVPGVGLGLAASEQLMLSEVEMKGSQGNTVGKVSSIRIRRTPARHQANLTPMGLPRPVRLNKKEFSLEEIYTNKNYRTPTEKRSFETIFEVPLERNGALIFTSQRKLKRAVEFQEGGLPRKQRRPHCRGGRRAGRRCAQPPSNELEEMLRQRLAELDALFEGDVC